MDVSTITQILLDQVSTLRLTDQDAKKDLGVAGNNLDQVKFVRNKNYLTQMSGIV